jgi:predicted nucleic acid-binding protein
LPNITPLASMLGARSGICYNAISKELSERPEDMIESSEQALAADDKPRMAYLDVCALNRPLDDQSQMRIRLEADAVSLILSYVRSKSLTLAVSPVHYAEVAANPDPSRRSHVQLLLQELGSQIVFDRDASRRRAEVLVTLGMGTADAAHVALAEQVGCDFVTCDDGLLRQCRRIGVNVWFGTPIAYCDKEDLA